MNRFKLLILLVLTLGLFACSLNRTPDRTNYYILDYNGCNEDANLKLNTPFEYTVQINETRLPRTYDRNQIVSKYTFNQITYLRKHLWSSKLYDAIPNLIQQRIKCYNIFKRVEREFTTETPDFYIDTKVNSIEEYLDADKRFAHLKIEFALINSKTQKVVFTYANDRIKRCYSTGIDEVVSSLNDMILEETNSFSSLVVSYLKTGQIPTATNLKSLAEKTKDYEEIGGNLNNIGELFVPAIFDEEMEPEYYIYKENGTFVEEAKMGSVVRLPKDRYQLRIGSDESILEMVDIFPGYRKTITPSWGVLVVNIVDEERNDVKMRYEIFQESEERVLSLGSYYSSSDRITEPPEAHVLAPGMYKITINGKPYNTYIDFTSVTITKGETYELSMVVETMDENEFSANRTLKGAGIIRSDKDNRTDLFGKWNNALYVIANFNSDNETAEDERKTSMTFIGESDNQYDYEKGSLHYSMNSLYSIEVNWETDEEFKIKNDDYNLDNTIIYSFIGGLGVYGRADLESHFTPTYDYFADSTDKDVQLQNEDGEDGNLLPNKEKYKFQPVLFPMILKEGIGLNYRMFRDVKSVKFSVRGGIGWEQEINKSVYALESSSDTLMVYRELDNDFTTGVEVSALGTLAFKSFPIDYTLSADFLFPFDANDDAKYDIENILTINLIKNVSWDIKATMSKGLQGRDYWVIDYGTFLRLSLFY